MKIAVQGCCHGELDNIYASIQFADEKSNCKTDLLIICGDFQALRNTFDEQQMACPPKFRRLGGFHEYYSGAKLAPIKTMFVGGNHEASNYLWELYHGGFVAANIYFMGFAGIVTFAGLRIAGLSGIYNPQNYHSGHHETPPYTDSQIRSIYHVRKFEIAKLMLVSDPIDIFISHDWPAGIANYGDKASLLQKKKFLRSDIESNSLGSPPAMALLSKIKPKFWFAAHMHVKFSAIVNHGPTQTKFLALDKCLPNRDFLQFLDIPTPNHQGLSEIAMDPEWLSIVKSTNHHMSLTRIQHIPSQEDLSRNVPANRSWIDDQIKKLKLNLRVPDFKMTAPAHIPGDNLLDYSGTYSNPQTVEFCQRVGIVNHINTDAVVNPAEIDLQFDDSE